MLLDQGSWNGKQVLSKDWVRRSIEPSQELYPLYGLLWWLHFESETVSINDEYINYYRAHGMTPTSLARLDAVKRKPLEIQEARNTVRPIIRGDEVIKKKLDELDDLPQLKSIVSGPLRSFAAQGYLGQYLIVIPRDRIVAVRQRRGPGGNDPDLELKRGFVDFADMVAALVDIPARTKG
jgi:hypothetical protein